MPILTSPPLLLNSALEPATGTVIVKVTAPIRYGDDQVTRAAAQGRIVGGMLKNAAGDGPLVVAATPVEGPAMEMWFSLNEFRDGRIQQSVSHRTVRVPFVSEVSLDDLIDVTLAAPDGSYVVPQDVQLILDGITGAGTTATDAAAAAEVSRIAAEEARDSVPTLEVLSATIDGKIAAIPTSTGTVSGPAYFWSGDSLSAQGGSAGQAPGSFFATLTGKAVSINAVGGETSAGVAARQGALPLLVSPASMSIPASGAVNVTLASPSGAVVWPLLQTAGNPTIGKTWVGTVAGIPGTLALVQPSGPNAAHLADDYYTFTRTTTGTAATLKRPAPFIITYAEAHRADVQVIWAGRNNFSAPDQVVNDVAAMVQHLTPGSKRFLVLGVHNGTGEGNPSTAYTQITTLNARLAAIYGRRFVDIRRALIDYGLAETGIVAVAQDVTDIAADTVPDSLRTDTVHLEIPTRAAVAQFIYERVQELGWETLVAPVALAFSIVDSFDRADSADIGTLWATQANFSIASNKLTPSDTATTVDLSLLSGTIPSPDHRVSALVTRGGSSSTGLVARAVDESNYYGVRANATGNVLIYKLVAGATTSLAGADGMGWVDGAKLGLSVVGNTFTAYINDVAVITTTHTDATLAGGVKAGVRSGSAATKPTFDNFAVTPS